MLYEPFMLNMVWKSTERFGNLSLEKYGFFQKYILKWKMCRNPKHDVISGRLYSYPNLNTNIQYN